MDNHHVARDIGSSIVRSATELLYFYPVLYFIGFWATHGLHLEVWSAALVIYYPVGYACNRFIPWKLRWLRMFIALLLCAGSSFLLWGVRLGIWTGIIGLIMGVRGMRSAERPWREDFSILLQVPSILLYWGITLLDFLTRGSTRAFLPDTEMSRFFPWLGILSLCIMLFMANSEQLHYESRSYEKSSALPRSILRQNRLWIVGMLAIVFIVGTIRQIQQFLHWLTHQLLVFLGLFEHWLLRRQPKNKTAENMGNPAAIHGQVGSHHNSHFWQVLISVLGAVGYIVLFLFIITLLFILIYRLLRILVRWLVHRFQGEAGESNIVGYEDEKEQIMNLKKMRKKMIGDMRDWWARMTERDPKWSDLLSAREKIRYLYRRFILKQAERGYHFKTHLTPNESAEDLNAFDERLKHASSSLSRLYTDTRYGDREPDEKTVEALRKTLNDSSDLSI